MLALLEVILALRKHLSKSSVDSIGLVGRMMSADIVAAVNNVQNNTGVNFLSTEHYNPSYLENPTSVGISI